MRVPILGAEAPANGPVRWPRKRGRKEDERALAVGKDKRRRQPISSHADALTRGPGQATHKFVSKRKQFNCGSSRRRSNRILLPIARSFEKVIPLLSDSELEHCFIAGLP